METISVKCGGIILCGGQSSRMGQPKATLPFGPETMLARVVRLLGEVVEPIVVVAAKGQQLPPLPAGLDILVAHDRQPGRGPLEGLRAGLSALDGRADAAYVTSCDVPLLSGDFVRHMIERLDDHEIAVPVDGKYHHPLAAVYRIGVLARIERLLDEDRLRPFYLFGRCDTNEVPVERLREVDAQLATLENLNSPADYLAALARAGFEPPKELRDRFGQDG